ncbi:glycosyltransferase family 2 protein [Kockovaella imperatae]|uniref:chitin synthase n=1 Tax=Kockovaella imperatae TaxID=4999 RepID=A0A1Y1UAS3_9TREE|nr:glycosyltransferase family 2 protein [Kockovaella imperatae]ORX35119.1 glycosyltransferase family 2 protein [Kockovaella imperatae]
MSVANMTAGEPSSTRSLTSLIASSSPHAGSSSSTSRSVFPTDETITSLLSSRARLDLPYTRVGSSGTSYVVVNPLRMLESLGEASEKEYERDVESVDSEVHSRPQPHVYELAGRAWMLMHRRKESQSILYHGATGSGKSTASRHVTSQILRLASHTKAQRRISDQINYVFTLLESFGHSKTPLNPSASQHSKYLELHFASDGSVCGAKVLPFGLNKSRLGRLHHDERSFHVFYQLLAGASPGERDALDLEDPSSYAVLAQSGCYRLPGGLFSDDAAQLGELRAAFASLGFKSKHVQSIFSLLTTILLLSNLTFVDDRQGSLGMTSIDESARAEDQVLLATVARHLGVHPDELEKVLVNRTRWIRHDLCSMILDVDGALAQRDALIKDLYAILFTFVVEMANRKLAPPNDAAPELQIVQLDVPGYQSRTVDARLSAYTPLINAQGSNGFNEFSANFINEVVHSYLVQRLFEDDSSMGPDGLPHVSVMDNGCLELLRGGLLGSSRLSRTPGGMLGVVNSQSPEDSADHLVGQFDASFIRSASYISSPPELSKRSFGINHYSGSCIYDAYDFVEANCDTLDKQLVDLLRSSSDPFVSKLVSGPGLATEGHPMDASITVQAQVSVTPLRTPTQIVNPVRGAKQSDADWPIDTAVPQPVTTQINATLSTLLNQIDSTRVWTVACIRPNDSGHPNSFDKRRVKIQVKALLLPELVNRNEFDYVADISLTDFCQRHAVEPDGVHKFAESYGWSKSDYQISKSRIWLSWDAWKMQEDIIRRAEGTPYGTTTETFVSDDEPKRGSYLGVAGQTMDASTDDLLLKRSTTSGDVYSPNTPGEVEYKDYQATPDFPTNQHLYSDTKTSMVSPIYKEDDPLHSRDAGDMIVHEKKHQATEVIATTTARRWWLRITWMLTWWIPSFLLSSIGGMKRADVRMAWREKLAIFMMIIMMCGVVLFYIVGFGLLLCPDSDKAWNPTELSEHAGTDDYYAAIAGKVYDFTNFYKGQHSDIKAYPTSATIMLEFAGQDLTHYFPMPMTLACPNLVTNNQLSLLAANFTPLVDYAIHTSGAQQQTQNTKLDSPTWYTDTLMPDLVQYYKGSFVYDKQYILNQADGSQRQWAIYQQKVYDLSDYLYTVQYYSSSSGTDLPNYGFFNSDLSGLFQTQAGQDITQAMNAILAKMSTEDQQNTMECLNNAFYVGELDYRRSARCTVQNYLLLSFSVILMTVIGSKFLAALQLSSKRQPELLDKFVICQVPCYTEGEESLKRTIDSLSVLNYDDKRKLMFIICDGNIIGSGNNRPTPRIVLDILGVDPKLDPEPLLFKSVGEGSRQLNYAKVYSGLYEHEGHVVPYVVIVKVGKPTETSKPGNRGKRDSQVLLLQYLNRVHFDAAMCPLELEIYHQMRNVIGIDPTFYEYIFQVDADTTVTPDSLNRLIACTADDQRIIGICGETKVENERESLTTMIQVYEYYISHHLTKAFESLFGSVTCLPGCFSVYRIRTADKGRPVIISSLVIDEYAEPNVDTLHKKNLFSLGEDRYLTTLMMKHFPTFKLKFTPDAIAHTIAPSRWNVLLSQRRRWINSTIHNLAELMFLPEMCGFCFFSMRFVVFIDLLGTIILPATCAYLIYLVVIVSTGKAAIPVISLAMIASVYGLQALIFILKREFMLVGWMVLYILAFPVYSVFLPLYSFWSMDDFSWGNTRKVVGEGNNKTVVYDDDEPFSDSLIPYKRFKDYESGAWETGSIHSEKSRATSHTSNTRTSRARPRPGPASAYSQGSELPPGADYWRDASPLGPSHSSRNLQNMTSGSNLRQSMSNPYLVPQHTGELPRPRVTSMAGLSMWGPGSDYGGPTGSPYMAPLPVPSNPFDSPAISDYGGAGLRPPTVFLPYQVPGFLSGNPGPPRNSVMSGLNTFASGGPMLENRGSTYSLATTANPFGGMGGEPPPTTDTDAEPSDDKVLDVLRRYLASQDLMSITKRQTREALYGLFPNADLASRAAWLNQNIDQILSST